MANRTTEERGSISPAFFVFVGICWRVFAVITTKQRPNGNCGRGRSKQRTRTNVVFMRVWMELVDGFEPPTC